MLKQALSQEVLGSETNIIAACIGIAFFSTPHHGSKAFSRPELARGISECLGLKFEMGSRLCKQFTIGNTDLELLNAKFCDIALGIRIWSFSESQQTEVPALINSPEGETLDTVNLLIVEGPSAALSADETLIDEERRSLLKNHAGVTQILRDQAAGSAFVQILIETVEQANNEQCVRPQSIVTDIVNGCPVYVHRFYQSGLGSSGNINVSFSKPSLRSFRDFGPSRALETTRPVSATTEMGHHQIGEGTDHWHLLSDEDRPSTAGGKPSFDSRRSYEENKSITASRSPSVPTITITDVDNEIETALNVDPNPPTIPGNQKALKIHEGLSRKDVESEHPRKHTHGWLSSSELQETDRFNWIHVPANICGWVPRILKTVAEDKIKKRQYKRLVREWQLHENRSRQVASSHARFIRTHCKLFHARQDRHSELSGTSSSTTIQASQLVLNFPYL